MDFLRWGLKKVKLFFLYFRRIIFVRNKFKVPFIKKLRANIFGGYLADQWALYDFDHNDKHEYLSEFDWYRSRFINEPFEFMMNNKIVCTEMLQQYTYVPEIYLLKNKGMLFVKDQSFSDYDYAVEVLKEHKNLFIKPFGSGKGKGVYQFHYKGGQIYIDGKEKTEEEYIQLLRKEVDWMLCQGIEQHSYSEEIYDKTLNTMRIITMRDIHTNQLKVFFAVQRLGTKDTIPVDNGSRGGLVSNIDLETGTLSEARCLHNKNVYEKHPDSGHLIKGVVIPEWDEIKNEVLDLAKKFPYMHLIAWDILLTEKGICVIEANNSSGVNIIQLWGGQRHGELGDFYRHHGAIKK